MVETILPALLGYIVNGIKNSKTLKKVSSDITDPINKKALDLWENIKPGILNKKVIEIIEKDPLSEVAQAELKKNLIKQMEDENFRKKIIEAVSELHKLDRSGASKATINKKLNSRGDYNINTIN